MLDRIGRYQTVAGATQAYGDEARKKLFDKLNRAAANLDLDMDDAERERMARRVEILKKAGLGWDADRATGSDAAASAIEPPEGPNPADAPAKTAG